MTSSRAALPLLLCASALGGGLQRFEAVEPHMGTLVRIEVYASGEPPAAAAFRAAFDRIAQLDNTLSDYKPDSELNRLTAGRPVPVSADLFRVLEASQQLARDTGGAFDITIGPVTRLWREARKAGRLPDSGALSEASSHSGYRKLHLDPARRTVLLDDPAMRLDPGGIAKGYAADEALAVLTRAGIRSALVAMSGDLAFSDPPPGRHGWKIDAGGEVLALSRAAVSTSGAAEQHLDDRGKRYSHIIDPATGMGVTRPITVTVIAPRGMEADGLATAVSILGADRGTALAQGRPGVRILIRRNL